MVAGDGKGMGPLFTMQAYFEGQMKVEDFARTGEDRPTTPHDVFDETLPVVDIAAIKGLGSEEERQANVAVMLEAAKSWGFFQISNHGIPLEAVRQAEAHVKEFFALPMERKLHARPSDAGSLFGYSAGSPIKWTSKWWLEALHLKVIDDVLEDLVTKTFPDEPQHAARFKHDLKAFLNPVHELARFLVEELTQALGLKRDTFTRLEVTQSNSAGRMNHYPVCPDPDSVLGIPGHSDLLMATILHQADASGLQVLKDGRWVGIRPEKSTLVVNIGDTFMALTNGILHSAVHRAVVNAKTDRHSIAYFYGIDNSVTLTVPPELITDARPLKYRPFSINEHRKFLMENELPVHAARHLQIDPEDTTT